MRHMLIWAPGDLEDAAVKVGQLEATVSRDAEYNAYHELAKISDELGMQSGDPVMAPIYELISNHAYLPAVPIDVIRLISDVLWSAARQAANMKAEIARECGRVFQGLPYTG